MSAQAFSLKSTISVADSELVARSMAGREECFEELVRRYQRPIAAYVYRMVGDYDSALDLTQEVFIRVYSSLARYRSEFKFSTWIYRIAHNAAIDHLRRCDNSRTEDLCLESEGGEVYEKPLMSGALTPEQESEREERRAEIEDVVGQLPSAYRELIVLRHAHDMSYDEIAEVTSLPLGTVKNRIFRAREAMRALLVERGITHM
jgi:RNA polymerase sigma-70 factor (ECF subfamily)